MQRTGWFMAFIVLTLALLPGVQVWAAPSGSDETMLAQGGGRMRGGGRQMNLDKRQKEMGKQFDAMVKYLGLDEKQEKEARALFKERNEKMKALFEQMRDGKVDQMGMRDSMREIGADFREKFDKLLTEEQRRKHEQWSHEHARDGGPGAGDGLGGER